jgi:hypothetical protein
MLVPKEDTISEYVHRTGNFQTDIVAVVKEKQEQYTVWYRSSGELKLATFKMLHVCHFKLERTKEDTACPCYKLNEEQNTISNIIYSKQLALEAPQI